MPERETEPFAADSGIEYTIRVEGVLSTSWAAWFDGLTVSHDFDETTVISGRVVDQAALHRVIRKIRDLGVTLISIRRSKQ